MKIAGILRENKIKQKIDRGKNCRKMYRKPQDIVLDRYFDKCTSSKIKEIPNQRPN